VPSKYTFDPYYDTPEWRLLRAQVVSRDKRTCRYCGEVGHQADHVVPRSRGGADRMDNLVCCCARCNKTARASVFVSFEAKKAWVLAHRYQTPYEPPPRRPAHTKAPVVVKRKLTGLRLRLALKNRPPHVTEALWRKTLGVDP
jgi:hypothetical protein